MRTGIDLGTTYSLMARLGEDGVPALIPDSADARLMHTPSAVCEAGGRAFVGRAVDALLQADSSLNALRFFKRELATDKPIYFDGQGRAWFAETASAFVLRKLMADLRASTPAQLDGAVITVPAHFNDRQRKAVVAAAALAEVPVLGLLEEPIAAALHYGVTGGSSGRILMVYDFGGGTFDATILTVTERGVYVLANEGVTNLGGKDLDERVAAVVLRRFEAATGRPLEMTGRTLLDLRRVAEEFKIELGMPGISSIRKLVVLRDDAADIEISRGEFEAAIESILDDTERVLDNCLRGAGLSVKEIDSLLLVGGSSLLPAIHERMRKRFGHSGQQVLYHEPTKAVVLGAAMHAAQLAGDAERYDIPPEFRGVTGFSVGARVMDPATGTVSIDTLIRRNLPLPVTSRKTYYTTRPDQTRMILDLVQFREQDELVPLGELVISPLPSAAGNYPIDVTVSAREDGTIAVSARDARSGLQLAHVFGPDESHPSTHVLGQRAIVKSLPVSSTFNV